MAQTLRPTKAPNQPIAPVDYDQRFQDQFSNVLRLYFNEIDNLTQNLMQNNGGRFLNFPQGSFYDTTNQYDGSTTIPYAVRLGQTSTASGVTIGSRTVAATGSIGPASTTMTITAITSGRFYPSMLLSGTSVTSGTYVYLQLSSTATAIATPTGSGGGAGLFTFTVSDATGIEARQFVSGTGIVANTRVVSVVGTTITVNTALTGAVSGTVTFRPWGYEGTYLVSPSQTTASTTISGNLPSLIIPAYSGVYNIQYSLQFTNTDNNTIHDVDVWFRKNDVDIDNSNSVFSVPGKHTGANGQLIAVVNFFVEAQAGDEFEIIWHTSSSTVYIETIPAQTSPIRPAAPSAIATVSFVSELDQ
jgi:hypothetical protein